MPNRSLDDFVGESEEEMGTEASDAETGEAGVDTSDAETEAAGVEASDADAGGTDAETVAPESAPETVEPDEETDDGAEPTLTVEEATPTYDFSPDGVACEACGETVETRWHDPDGGMVCADCKRWD